MSGMNSHVNLSLTTEIHNALKIEAKEKEISLNAYVREVLKMRNNLECFPQIVDLLIKLLKNSRKWKS